MAQTKKLFGLVATLLLALLVVHGETLGVPQAYALQAGQQVRGALGAEAVSLMGMLGIVITFLHTIGLIALWILQYLLSTEFLNDPVMLANLNQIWVLSRDIMNLGFALMLIGVAIYTIITADKEKIKSHLVQFATAVIFVNFSWFFPRVIIDVANILTSTIYSIPNMLPSFSCVMRNENNVIVPCRVLLDVEILPDEAKELSYCSGLPPADCQCLSGLACYKKGDFVNAINVAPGHAMINGLAVSFARLDALARVPASPISTSGSNQNAITISLHLLISTVLAFVLMMAVVLPLVGLMIGLIIRMVILWVCVAFMPFAFIGYAMNKKLGVPGLPAEYDIWQNFKTAAFLPTVVAIPICIGFIMLSSVSTMAAPNNGLVINVPLVNGINDWWGLMWLVAAIGIIYTGAFTALKSNQIIGQFTEKVKGFGDSIAGAAAQAPMLIPLPLPAAAGGNMNLGQLLNKPNEIRNAINARTRNPSGPGGQAPGVLNTDAAVKALSNRDAETRAIVQAIDRLKTLPQNDAARAPQLQAIRDQLRNAGVQNVDRLTNDNVLQELRRIAERQGPGGSLGGAGNIEAAIKGTGR